MGQPLKYDQILYNEVIYQIEQDWQRPLTDHEKHLAILSYRYGRTTEAENEIKILSAK